MRLACKFEVTLDGVALKDMWLRLPGFHSVKIINNF